MNKNIHIFLDVLASNAVSSPVHIQVHTNYYTFFHLFHTQAYKSLGKRNLHIYDQRFSSVLDFFVVHISVCNRYRTLFHSNRKHIYRCPCKCMVMVRIFHHVPTISKVESHFYINLYRIKCNCCPMFYHQIHKLHLLAWVECSYNRTLFRQ